MQLPGETPRPVPTAWAVHCHQCCVQHRSYKIRQQHHCHLHWAVLLSDPDCHKSGTRLSRHIGELKKEKIPDRLDWKIICETKSAYNPKTNYCKLCTMEKYFIMFNPDDATLNLRSEFFSHCRHKSQHLLTQP